MRKLGIGIVGRVGALALGIATVIGCGDNGVTPPDAPVIDTPPPTPAMLTLSPTTNDFGAVVLGDTSAAATFTVTNAGEDVSGSISPVITGANASEFTAQNGCTTLAGAGTCTITVTFTPTSAGAKTANLVVNASPGGTVMATLLATGQTPGTLSIAPSSLAFGSIEVGTASTSQTFTISNTGSVATSALTVTKAGSNPAEFTVGADTCSGMTLAGGANCTIEVSFTPSAAGMSAASIVVSATTGGSVNGAVTGTGLDPASLSVSPGFQDFGTVTTGLSSGNITFTVSNTGDIATSTITDSFTGTNPTEFVKVSSTCTTLNPGASCTIVVRFAPQAPAGAKSATLNVTATIGGSANSSLIGNAVAPGNISISPTPFAFPDTTVGQTSTSQLFTVLNTGGSPTGALGTALGGVDPAQFQIVMGSNGCQGVVLAPAATCTIAVIFGPTSGGNKSASLTVTHTGGSTAAAISGLGISPAQFTLTPASRDFGSVVTGTMSSSQDFVLENVGGQTSGVPAVAVNGANASEFMANASGCGAALIPGATCTISVIFAPATQGAKTASLDVTGTGGPVSSALSGAGVSQAALAVNPTIITFPQTLVGDSSATQMFTVTNQGSVNTGTLTVSIVGAHPGDFSQTNNCADGAGPGVDFLIPGGICTVVVTFSPTSRDLRSATVQIAGTPGGTVGVAVSGNSLPKLEITAPTPVVYPINTYTYPNSIVDPDAPFTVVIGLRNNSATNFPFVAAPTFTGGHFSFVSTTCGGTLAAGGTCTYTVNYTPQTVATHNGSVLFTLTGAGAGNTAQQNLTGSSNVTTLVISDDVATPTTHNFGNRPVGSSSNIRTFTVRNAGMMPTGLLAIDLAGGPFQITSNGCSGISLNNNDTCTIGVIFTPTTTGAASATLTVRASQPAPVLGGMVSATVNGTGVAAVGLSTPTSRDFGTLFAGETSTTLREFNFQIRNPNDTTTPLGITVNDDPVNPSFTRIAVGGNCGATLGAGATCNVRIRFTPILPVGPRAGSFTVSQSLSGQSLVVPLTGNVRSTISLVAAPTPFSNIVVGATSAQTLMVRNDTGTGGSTLQTIGGFAITAGGAPFFILSNTCTTLTTSNQTCSFSLSYQPVAPGADNRVLSVTATNGLASASVPANAITAANLQITGAGTSFGSEIVGQLGSTRVYTVTNLGQQTSGTVSASLMVGTSFTITANTCTGTLAFNATCLVTVRFNPVMAGAQADTLLVSGTPGGMDSVAISGLGVGAGGVQVSPTSFTFADTTAGQVSLTQPFTVQNTSASTPATLTIVASADFQVVGAGTTCTGTLAAGATCTVQARFTPGTAGAKTGTLQIVTGSTFAALSGRGLTVANVVNNVGASFTNPAAIGIGPAVGGTSTSINVTGVQGNVSFVSVTINGLSHTWPGDVDMALVSPDGRRLALMSDSGGGSNVSGLTLTFADGAANLLPTTTLSSGSFRPTDRPADFGATPEPDNYVGLGTATQSAPQGTGTLANVFTGAPANGTWTLYVSDDAGGDMGSISGGWTLNLNATGFADQTIMTSSAPRTVVFSNLGESTAAPLAATQTGPDGTHFQLMNNCAGVALTPVGTAGSTCTVVAVFAPTTTGAKTTQLNFTGPITTSIVYSGTGVNPAMLAISPSVVQNDGSRPIGAADGAATIFTISNLIGSATTSPISFSLSNAANYALSPADSTCLLDGGQTLAPGASCTVGVFFNPTQLGPQSTNVVVMANNTVNGLMTGTGTQAIVQTAGSGAFGTQNVGTASATRTFTFRNDSDVPTTLIQTTLTNTTGMDFSITSDACGGVSLAPGASCNVVARFVPSGSDGARAATLQLQAVVTGTTTTATVSFTGTANAP